MAIPEKRALGTFARWLGIKFLVNLGICYLPTDKELHAVQDISLMLDRGSKFDKYKSLLGLPEHVRQSLFLLGNVMYGLSEPFTGREDPGTNIHFSELMMAQLRAWRARIPIDPARLSSRLASNSKLQPRHQGSLPLVMQPRKGLTTPALVGGAVVSGGLLSLRRTTWSLTSHPRGYRGGCECGVDGPTAG